MKCQIIRALGALVAVLPLAAVAQTGLTGGTTSLGLGADYSTGTYGNTQSTDVWYFPLIGKYETERWILKLTVPYLSVTGPGAVVGVGAGAPIVIAPGGTSPVRTDSGLGDIVAGATYSVVSQPGLMVDVTGKIKLPTADESKGLGSGQTDYSFQFDAYKTMGAFTAFGGLGYRWYGDPPGLELNDVFFASVGGTYKLSATVSAGASLDFRQKILSNRDDIIEFAPFVSWKVTQKQKLQFYVVRGFTDASVDWGGGVLLFHSF